MADRSLFANFVTFLRSIKDDVSNVTSPPSFLAPQTITEISTCWAERPKLFVAPTFETSPERRCLAVLKWIIASHRRQFYIGEDVSVGIRKPLNSFLGEVFLEQWTDEVATTKLVAEQVSYQPAVTACHISSDEHKIWGDGFSRIEMSFNGSLMVRQTGYAMLHLDQHDEHYLIQLPNVEVHGFLTGHLYPEIQGTYNIISTSGFKASITYSGQGWLSGTRNEFEAKVFRVGDTISEVFFIVAGCWSDHFSIYDHHTSAFIDEWSDRREPPAHAQAQTDLELESLDQWESRRAWRHVKNALDSGDLSGAINGKLSFDRAQAALRTINPHYDSQWEPLFFTASAKPDPVLEFLASSIDGFDLDRMAAVSGLWRHDEMKARNAVTPYHGGQGPARLLRVAGDDDLMKFSIHNPDEDEGRSLETICESELPLKQREYLRARRRRKLTVCA